MCSPKGQPVRLPTPAQPTQHYGIGAVNSPTGATVALVKRRKRRQAIKRRKRRQAIAQLLEALLNTPPTATLDVAWANAGPPEDDAVAIVLRSAAGRLVVLS